MGVCVGVCILLTLVDFRSIAIQVLYRQFLNVIRFNFKSIHLHICQGHKNNFTGLNAELQLFQKVIFMLKTGRRSCLWKIHY